MGTGREPGTTFLNELGTKPDISSCRSLLTSWLNGNRSNENSTEMASSNQDGPIRVVVGSDLT